MPTWETAIADARTSDITVRGYPLDSLVEHVTFADTVYLLLSGELPTRGQREMVDAILVSLAERGIAPSSMIARTVASAGSPLQAAVAAGLLSVGDRIGGACEAAARTFAGIVADGGADVRRSAADAVRELRDSRRRIPGFGYPEHESRDPRAVLLFKRAHATGVWGPHCELVGILEDEIESQSGRRIPANVNGALAAITLDMGLPAEATRAFILLPRVAGLAAHVMEETSQGARWRGADADDVSYAGPQRRELTEPYSRP